MDPKQISTFAKLLRENADKILNSQFKLTLSGSLLRALNDSFTLIADQAEVCSPQSFQVVKPNNSKSDVFRDLQFIHDFVQKTIFLCITHYIGDECFDGIIDITKFRSLRQLEVKKVNIKQVTGIQQLRTQLKELVCVRSIECIEDIISYCGGDDCNGFVWNELHAADFSYNNLKTVNCSLEFAQWLQNLNLSHNQITSVDAIKWLPNLKTLDLSFNRMTHIPGFHIEASRRLQILILNNNFIENIIGISRLDALTELDLSDNCLLDHSYLLPLSTLVALRYLNLTNNPLYCHPRHRQATTRYLNKNTASVKFILDSDTLTKGEKALTGSCQGYYLPSTRLPGGSSRTTGLNTPSKPSQNHTPASSVGSKRSFKLNETEANPMTTSMYERQQQRKLRARTVEIEDLNVPNIQRDYSKTNNKISNELDDNNLESNKEHLETKRQIEDLRERFGSGWLQSENAQIVHNVLGIEQNVDTQTRKISSQQIIDDLLGEINKSTYTENINIDRTNLTSTPVNESEVLNLSDVSAITIMKSPETTYDSVNDTTDKSLSTVYQSVKGTPDLNEIYPIRSEEEATFSEAEDNEKNYIVRINDQSEELFLVVSDMSIKEKNILTGRTKTKWSLKTLESCDRIKSDTIRINFDTIKKDKKERIYIVQEELCQELEKYLRDILSNRPLSELNQTLYRCINCTTTFSRENNYKKVQIDISCPECKSTYVVEIRESPPKGHTSSDRNGISVDQTILSKAKATVTTSNNTRPQSGGEKPNLIEKSASHSSIAIDIELVEIKMCDSEAESEIDASDSLIVYVLEDDEDHLIWFSIIHQNCLIAVKDSSKITFPIMKLLHKRLTDNKSENCCRIFCKPSSAGSLNESSSCSKISNSESSFDSNQSVAGSSTQDRDAEFNTYNKNATESDIEILSNPSQSSIEVLDNANSSRKTSEERRISQIPSLETIEDGQLIDIYNNLSLIDIQSSSPRRLKDIARAAVSTVHNDDQISLHPHEKKPNNLAIANINLTESSSSGSVTDSICTAYDQSENKLDTTLTTESKSSPQKSPEKKNTKVENSLISSMFGGLFQSTNILMSRSQKSVDSDSSPYCEKFKFSYRDFSEADHRLKLFFYQNIFEDQNEHFKWLVKGKIIEENTNNEFDGIIVMSTTKFYILEIIGKERDEISKWLKRNSSGTVDRFEYMRVLPWKIGLSFTVKGIGSYHLLLQDILRTDSLLLFFANNPLPDECQLDYEISPIVQKKISFSADDEQIKMFSLINSCEISDDTQKNISTTAFFTTDSNLYLTTSSFDWLSENSEKTIEISHRQLMTNLVEIERPSKNAFIINFLDDNQDKSEVWKCIFETEENADSCYNAIGQSWEKLFGVPLGNN